MSPTYLWFVNWQYHILQGIERIGNLQTFHGGNPSARELKDREDDSPVLGGGEGGGVCVNQLGDAMGHLTVQGAH